MRHFALIAAFLLAMLSVGQAQVAADLQWIQGRWQTRSGNTSTIESWTYMPAKGLVGNSETTEGGKVVFTEKLTIKDSLGQVFYIAVLPFKTGTFTLDTIAANMARFIDPRNDFPHTLLYQRKGDQLDVTLLGTVAGKEQREILHFILTRP